MPVLNGQKYADGKAGRWQWDLVHTISYCAAVLHGDEPEDNERKISKPIAIILLAHFLGDIPSAAACGRAILQWRRCRC